MSENEFLESKQKRPEVKYIKPEIGSGYITPSAGDAKQQEAATTKNKKTK